MRGRGGIFGFSILELAVIIFCIIYNRLIFKVLHKSLMGGYGAEMPDFNPFDGDDDDDVKTWSPEVKNQWVSHEEFEKIRKTINPLNLHSQESAYLSIANTMYNEMNGLTLNPYTSVYNLSKGLNADELRMVYVQFELATKTVLGFTVLKNARLIQWFEDTFRSSQELELKTIWEKSGLWR